MGILEIRYRKEILEDGIVISFGYHRDALEPGTDFKARMKVVNNHLAAMECGTVSGEEIDLIDNACNTVWTPEVKEKFRLHKEKHARK